MTLFPQWIGPLCSAALLLSGCSRNKPAELNKEEEQLKKVSLAYRDASTALKGGPANLNELKPYLSKYGDPDQLLISPNDGQPYEIVWGITPLRPSQDAQTKRFLAHEKTGKDGKRYAVDFRGNILHLSDAEFTKMLGSK